MGYWEDIEEVKKVADALVTKSLKEKNMRSGKEEQQKLPMKVTSSEDYQENWWDQPGSDIELMNDSSYQSGKIWDYKNSKWITKKAKDGVTTFVPKNGKDSGSTGFGFSSAAPSVYQPPCKHGPTLVMEDKKAGWSVSVGKKYDCEDNANDFDIIINLMGSTLVRKHHIPITELKKWEQGGSLFQEVMLDWPDMGIVRFPLQFWLDLKAVVEKKKAKVLVFCMGGHGRTGTVLACLLVAWYGWSADKAMNWVWDNYCKKAIESRVQDTYIETIEKEYKKKFKE